MNLVAQLDSLLLLMAVFGGLLGGALALYVVTMLALWASLPRRWRRT